MLNKTRNHLSTLASNKLGLAVVAGSALTATPALAVTAGDVATNLNGQFNSFGKVLVNGCFLVGVGTAGMGLWEMKKAGDGNNQGRESHKSGVIKLLVGGGLAAVPAITGVGIGTIFNGSGTTAPTTESINVN